MIYILVLIVLYLKSHYWVGIDLDLHLFYQVLNFEAIFIYKAVNLDSPGRAHVLLFTYRGMHEFIAKPDFWILTCKSTYHFYTRLKRNEHAMCWIRLLLWTGVHNFILGEGGVWSVTHWADVSIGCVTISVYLVPKQVSGFINTSSLIRRFSHTFRYTLEVCSLLCSIARGRIVCTASYTLLLPIV